MDYLTVPDVPGFVVGRVLGRGGSSTVWLVTEERTGRDFALKCLAGVDGRYVRGGGSELPGDAYEDAIRREIRILSVLDHQHLIQAHDALRLAWPGGTAPGSAVGILLDYAPGGSLGELVGSRSKLTIGETVTVLTPIAQVLGYLHGRGFTHGDVSPGNVLFTGHGKPMLSDVGVARMVGDASPVPDHGTEGFMDPSPVDAVRAGLQPERDVYSVAALGWYCLTGEPPRRTADRAPLSLLLPEVPADLAALLEAGLNEDRRLRPTAGEFATAVYRSAAPLPVDLASSVHPTVIPELLTRRRTPQRADGALRRGLRTWGRRISTSRWSGLVGARQVFPFPLEESAVSAPPRGAVPTAAGDGREQAAQAETPARRGKHTGNRGYPGPAAHPRPKRRAVEDGSPGRPAAPCPPQQVVDPGRQEASRSSGFTAGPRAGHKTGRKGTTRHGPEVRRKSGAFPLAVGAAAVIAAGIWAAGAFGPGGQWGGPAGSGSSTAAGGATDGGYARGGTDAGVPGSAGEVVPAAVTEQLGSKDPLEAIRGLAAVRALAFRSGRLDLLELVNAPDSAAHDADARITDQLQASGTVLAGFTSTVEDLSLQPGGSSTQVIVGVTSATSSYEETDGTGAVVAAAAPEAEQKLKLVLVSVDGRWRISDVLPGS